MKHELLGLKWAGSESGWVQRVGGYRKVQRVLARGSLYSSH